MRLTTVSMIGRIAVSRMDPGVSVHVSSKRTCIAQLAFYGREWFGCDGLAKGSMSATSEERDRHLN